MKDSYVQLADTFTLGSMRCPWSNLYLHFNHIILILLDLRHRRRPRHLLDSRRCCRRSCGSGHHSLGILDAETLDELLDVVVCCIPAFVALDERDEALDRFFDLSMSVYAPP